VLGLLLVSFVVLLLGCWIWNGGWESGEKKVSHASFFLNRLVFDQFYFFLLLENASWKRRLKFKAEGSWDEVMRLIGQAHTLVHQNGVVRVQTDIRAGTRFAFSFSSFLSSFIFSCSASTL
jgi:hypothetical protein